VGADADLVVVDSERGQVVKDKDVLSRAGYSVLAGRELVGLPDVTICGGRVVWRDGRIVAAPGSGRWIAEKRDQATVIA
jgi:dihydropyrimidinase